MVNLIISIVVLCKAIARKRFSFVPVCLIIALYELVCLFEAAVLDYGGLLERVLTILLLAAVFFICQKKQLHISGVLFSSVAALLRWAWTRVFDWFQQIMQYPGSDALALLEQAGMVRSIFDAFISVMILALQILMIWELRKN